MRCKLWLAASSSDCFDWICSRVLATSSGSVHISATAEAAVRASVVGDGRGGGVIRLLAIAEAGTDLQPRELLGDSVARHIADAFAWSAREIVLRAMAETAVEATDSARE